MKKELFLLGFVFLVVNSIGNVYAVSSNLKDSYAPSETAIGSLSGNILEPIDASQIKLKRGYVDIAFIYDIKKLNGIYYIWLIAPQTSASYTLIIENIIEDSGYGPEVVDYEKNFFVNGTQTDYNINPGAIFAVDDFQIIAQLFGDAQKTIDVSFPSQRQVRLMPGTNYIDFSIDNVVGNQFVNIAVGKYSVPSYIIGNATPPANNSNNGSVAVCGDNIIEQGEQCDLTNLNGQTCQALGLGTGNLSCYASGTQYECRFNTTSCQNGTTIPPIIPPANNSNNGTNTTCTNFNGVCKTRCETNETKINASCESFWKVCCIFEKKQEVFEKPFFRLNPRMIESSVFISNKLPEYTFSITNLGNYSLNKVNIYYNKKLFEIFPSTNITIEPNSTAKFNLTLKTNATKEIKEVVFVKAGEEKKYLLVKIGFTTNESKVGTQYLREAQNRSSLYYCSELSGMLCSSNEICEGEQVASIENSVCCVGQCKEKPAGSSKAWIGYLIAAIVILGLLIVYIKFKKVKPSSNPIGKASIGKI